MPCRPVCLTVPALHPLALRPLAQAGNSAVLSTTTYVRATRYLRRCIIIPHYPLPHYHTQLTRSPRGMAASLATCLLPCSLAHALVSLTPGQWARTLPYSGFIKNCHSFFLPSLHRPACLPACWIPAKEGTSPQPTTTVVHWSWTSPLRRWPVTSTRCIAAPSNLFFEVKPPLRELLRQSSP